MKEIGSDEAERANCSGCQDACDPGGAMVDHVNWFGHKMDSPEGFTFEATSIGVDVLEEPPGPVGEEFYQNLATQFQHKCSGGTADSAADSQSAGGRVADLGADAGAGAGDDGGFDSEVVAASEEA